MDMKLPRDIKTALDTLPRGSKAYDCAYREAMDRVNRQGPISVKFAKKVLSWITCAKRPLSTMELQYALTVREIDEPELEDNLPQVADIVSVCAGLVTVDEESDIIRLVHYTTQEYFYRTKEQWFPTVESDIVTTCVRYLSFSSFESGYCETRKEFRQRLQLNPLYEYAAKNWGHHARITSMEEEEQRSILRFLGSEAKVSAAYQALVSGTLHYYGKETPTRITGVHLAVFFGLEKLITLVLKNTQSPDVRDSDGQTPLFYAVERSHEAVVKLLLEKSADPNLQDAKSRTPLFYAVDCGHEAVVKLLLEKSADPNLQDAESRTSLLYAVERGHEAVVKLLIENSADPNSKDEESRTPLIYAARKGYEVIVKLLLKEGANPNSNDDDNRTPLMYAAANGHEAAAKQLILARAGINSKDMLGATPLHWAAWGQHAAVVSLLLKSAADVNILDKSYSTPLAWAIEREFDTGIEMLLKNGSQVNYWYRLDLVRHKERRFAELDILNALPGFAIDDVQIFNLGDINDKDPNNYWKYIRTLIAEVLYDPVMEAVDSILLHPRHEKTRRTVLLNPSVNRVYKSVFDTYRKLCELADLPPEFQERIRARQQILTEMLNGELSRNNLKKVTPLLRAIEKGNQTAIRLLLEHGANPVSKGSCGWTPLSLAKRNGDMAIIKLLQSYGRSSKINPQPGETGYHQNDIST